MCTLLSGCSFQKINYFTKPMGGKNSRNLNPVSYTHLETQGGWLGERKIMSGKPTLMESYTTDKAYSCLLYTSRCV